MSHSIPNVANHCVEYSDPSDALVCYVCTQVCSWHSKTAGQSQLLYCFLQASRRGSKPKHEPQQGLLEAGHDPTEHEPHYTEVASLVGASSTGGPGEPAPQLSTSRLLKSLKAPQYDTVAETHQTARKPRDQVKSIQKALKPPPIDNLNPEFEIESTEFGFRPKYSSNPLQTLEPTLPTEDADANTSKCDLTL